MRTVKKKVNAIQVYEEGWMGRGIGIALLDTGVSRHPELKGRVTQFSDLIHGRKTAYDDNGHGTHIAGILCGNTIGMAPEAELFVFKILDEKGNGTTKTALRALEWILANGREAGIRILNFSMGYLPGANSKLQEELLVLLDEIWKQKIIVVTAAGNREPYENSITVPGILRSVITVGLSDTESFGGRGPTTCCIVKPEVLAPGMQINSCSHLGDGYVRKSGTSMATPVVSGALALGLQKNPLLTPAQMKLILYDSLQRQKVQENPASVGKQRKKMNSWGILDVDNLLNML